ncbi:MULTISPECIES: sporulation protein YunB [unclassified Brevibacillus]|uniref:Sporulation protein YunB n=1 Tax=Brevibacillus aydinogluensis TaxID=927786 RepID=A0AA48MAQ4_9BACL|nr:sporulation protein YunB [Brevibacillus sp. NL20B1]MDT3417253.1 sporulation protein YunB [Brevibacillus aydinogluensis]NNV03182.1 sporulation protein YunB [Brevibacillus sp. MCWH]REK65502.1 MAG: sporulation protein YunB [Brevibacillus sp.]UFJ62501.1 sporulation protein YunB [Anoxybacillus sediminis]
MWGYRKGGWRRRGRRLIATLLAVMAGLLVLFVIVERRIEPTLMLIAAQKTDQIAKLAISDAVTKRLTQQGIDFDDIVILEKDSDGNILAVNFNFKQYARIVGETTSRIQARLKEFEEENVVVTVPLGLATKNVFLEHFGPEIPVSFVPVGSVKTRLETGLKQAGINMVLITVYIWVEVDLRIVIPFATEQRTVTTQIPITEALIVGKVPDYLYNNPAGKPDVPMPRNEQMIHQP